MTVPGSVADLAALADWIDEQLSDELAGRQEIAESVASRIRGITLQMLGTAEPTRRAAPGPFETEAQARELPAVRAAYDASRASTRRGVLAERCHRLLDEACTAAGVEVGADDHRIITWLSGWEPEICAVVAGLVARGAAGREADR